MKDASGSAASARGDPGAREARSAELPPGKWVPTIMPANLSPEFKDAERRYKTAASFEEKMRALEEMLATIPKHKGTEKMQADLKTRLARMKQEGERRPKATSGFSRLIQVDREAEAMAVLFGPPNSGKSSLLRALSKATPEVAPYPYTTQLPCSGIARHEDVPIQVVDLPALDRERLLPWVIGIGRNADVLLLVVDLSVDPLSEIDALVGLLEESRLYARRDPAAERDELVRSRSKVAAVVAGKLDAPGAADNLAALRDLYQGDLPIVPVSAATGEGVAAVTEHVFRACGLLRVYAKQPGRPADTSAPFVLRVGATVRTLGERVHKDFADGLKFARVWGAHTFDGQRVTADFGLHDKDIVELHL